MSDFIENIVESGRVYEEFKGSPIDFHQQYRVDPQTGKTERISWWSRTLGTSEPTHLNSRIEIAQKIIKAFSDARPADEDIGPLSRCSHRLCAFKFAQAMLKGIMWGEQDDQLRKLDSELAAQIYYLNKQMETLQKPTQYSPSPSDADRIPETTAASSSGSHSVDLGDHARHIINHGNLEQILQLLTSFNLSLAPGQEQKRAEFFQALLSCVEDQNFKDQFATRFLRDGQPDYFWGYPWEQQCLEFLLYRVTVAAVAMARKEGLSWDRDIRPFVADARGKIQKWLSGTYTGSTRNFGKLVNEESGLQMFDFNYDPRRFETAEKDLRRLWGQALSGTGGYYTLIGGECQKLESGDSSSSGFAKYIDCSQPEGLKEANLGLLLYLKAIPEPVSGVLTIHSKADTRYGLESVPFYQFIFCGDGASEIFVLHPRYASVRQIRPFQEALAREIFEFPPDGDPELLFRLFAKYYYYGAQCPIMIRGGAACNEIEFVALCSLKGYRPPPLPCDVHPLFMDLEAMVRTEDTFTEFFLESVRVREGFRRI